VPALLLQCRQEGVSKSSYADARVISGAVDNTIVVNSGSGGGGSGDEPELLGGKSNNGWSNHRS